jgi:hypothetical protein
MKALIAIHAINVFTVETFRTAPNVGFVLIAAGAQTVLDALTFAINST